MPKPRKELISLEATPYYHCVSRCVRKAFLCGSDSTGRSFEHRRGWIEHLLIEQAKVFCIDIAAYAVMSNHFHIVLHVDQTKARDLSELEIVQRWHQLYKGNLLTQKFERGDELSEAQTAILEDIIKELRERLMSISWYMRRLNETVARLANEEDNCTGHLSLSAIHGLIPSGSLKAVQIVPYNLWTGRQIRENKRGAISECEP